jgi:integrase/recombinase XerD
VKAPVVRLKIRVRLPDGSRPFLDPVLSGNGKLKPLYALIRGNAEHHPEGTYFLRYLKNGKRVWEPVGSDPTFVLDEKRRREKGLDAQAAGVVLADESGTRTLLKAAIAEYLEEIRDAKAIKTFLAYSLTLRLFAEAVKRETLEQIDRKDVLVFVRSMREEKQSPRTIANRISYLNTFFRRFGLKSPLLKTDKVKFTDKIVAAYSVETLKALFAAASPEEYELFQFFLCTGARDQEVQHATWPDMDFHRKTFTVREKLDLGFTPKDKEEGSVPLPDDFVELMKARCRNSKHRLVFPGPQGKKNVHFLRILKRLALRTGLNCGQCHNALGQCCANAATCEQFGLHRFRKTFATFHHEAGVSARTIQRWLRHSSLDTTLRYLAGSDDQSEKTRGLVNSTFSAIGGAN